MVLEPIHPGEFWVEPEDRAIETQLRATGKLVGYGPNRRKRVEFHPDDGTIATWNSTSFSKILDELADKYRDDVPTNDQIILARVEWLADAEEYTVQEIAADEMQKTLS
ncbi:hypothetical protein DJ69_15610 [Halorubrum persicum]|uniref:Uncharacterized protein n=1 Tax=Halorubrum persicum TaxID=1383844 RepID=A0A2G1WFK7_9EURY|nr:hypothetical protein [Halorubrum persicum]PHQ37649.1 hypothetical protein DJ69_15610 [Halorubrum persicum]